MHHDGYCRSGLLCRRPIRSELGCTHAKAGQLRCAIAQVASRCVYTYTHKFSSCCSRPRGLSSAVVRELTRIAAWLHLHRPRCCVLIALPRPYPLTSLSPLRLLRRDETARLPLTRKPSYRKDDLAIRPICGRPENCRQSPSTPTATYFSRNF